MQLHESVIEVETTRPRELVDITRQARECVRASGVRTGLCALYAQGATL
jgi:thiamine phosphate synthase YjbQ (UPF0047 family)